MAAIFNKGSKHGEKQLNTQELNLKGAGDFKMQNNLPLEEQYPGDDASEGEILEWAQKAKSRIKRDISEKKKLKYKINKLREQLAGNSILIARLKLRVKDLEERKTIDITWIFQFAKSFRHFISNTKNV